MSEDLTELPPLSAGQQPPLFRPGHRAGDFLGAPEWVVEQQSEGFLALRVPLPDHVRNPAGQLFGGFTGTYVDLVALSTAYVGSTEPRLWLATTGMHLNYLAPVIGPTLVIEGRLTAAVGRTRAVEVRLFNLGHDQPAVLAGVTMRQLDRPPGSGH